jgi:hypothetical protein
MILIGSLLHHACHIWPRINLNLGLLLVRSLAV